MDKTVQSYLNEYISLIGKGKFVLLGGNTFMDGANPNLDRIVDAINKYTTTDGVTAEGIFESRLKNKAEVEIKKTDGTIEVAKGSATDAQYAAFVAEWKSIQEPLVKALIAQFDIVEKAKGAAPAGAPGLFGGLTQAELASGLNPLKKAGDVAAVLAAVSDVDGPGIKALFAFLNNPTLEFTSDNFKVLLADIKVEAGGYVFTSFEEFIKKLLSSKERSEISDGINSLGSKLFEIQGDIKREKGDSFEEYSDTANSFAGFCFELQGKIKRNEI